MTGKENIPVTLDEAFESLMAVLPDGWGVRQILGPGFNSSRKVRVGWSVAVAALPGHRFSARDMKGERGSGLELIDALLDAAVRLGERPTVSAAGSYPRV